MSSARLRSICPVALLAVAGLLSLKVARAQEVWGPARGGASTWGGGTAASSAATSQASGSGENTGWGGGKASFGPSWGAGKTSFGSTVQPGGVWSHGLTIPAAANRRIVAKGIAARALPSFLTPTPAGVRPAPTVGLSGAAKSKAQISRASMGPRSSNRPHFGMAEGGRVGIAKGGRAGAFRFPPARTAAFGSRGPAAASKETGTISGLGGLTPSAPELNPLANPWSGEPGLGAQTGLNDTLQ